MSIIFEAEEAAPLVDAPADGGYLSEIDRRLQSPGPKRILSLDGGGVKGILTSGMLEVIEERLRRRVLDPAAREAFRLCDYFDLIGGTSTGAIIATWLALGHTAKETTALYRELCPEVFRTGMRLPAIQAKFDASRLDALIRRKLSDVARRQGLTYADMTMDTPLLRTGLALFCKRADSGSPWVITNNPREKYWDRDAPPWAEYWKERPEERFKPNAKYHLGDVVRASAAAPTFLEAVEIDIDDDVKGRFVDGAVSTNNNPSLHLFISAALRGFDSRSTDDQRRAPFGLRWTTGPDRLFLLSLGTGVRRAQARPQTFTVSGHVEALRAVNVLATVIQDAMNQNVLVLQALSAPAKPLYLRNADDDIAGMLVGEKPLLTFRRINPRLEAKWLDENLPGGPPVRNPRRERPPIGKRWREREKALERAEQLDNARGKNLDLLHYIGHTHAERVVSQEDFPPVFDIEAMGGGAKAAEQRLAETHPHEIEAIARVAHEAVRAWQAALGQAPTPPWDDAEEWMRSSTLKSVAHRIANPSIPASTEHDRWMAEKLADGWTWGPVRDDTRKIHPFLVEYAHLPPEERKKDALILAVVESLWR